MKHSLYLFCIFCLSFFACDDSSIDLDQTDKLTDAIKSDNFVTKEEAISIANLQFSHSERFSSSKSVQIGENDVHEYKYNTSLPQLYIINNRVNKEFIIISGDKRAIPILGYSDLNEFPIGNNEEIPLGLSLWMESMAKSIDSVRYTNNNDFKNKSRESLVREMWKTESEILTTKSYNNPQITYHKNRKMVNACDAVTECSREGQYLGYYGTYIDPYLLTSKWSQGNGFNKYVKTTKSCSNYSFNLPPAGCTAIAVAQVMKYNRLPSTYDWGKMYDVLATDESAKLIADIGNKIGINYDCEGSGGSMDNVLKTLKEYGYGKAKMENSISNIAVIDNLTSGYPLIFSGGRKSGWWIFAGYKDGHAWVVDGIRYEIHCDCIEDYEGTAKTRYVENDFELKISYHCNWGWGGSYDGWYAAKGFSPSSYDFNYQNKVIYNIIPN